MMKYPIGIQSFNQLIEDGYVYVDKTALVYNLVKNGKIYFLSRPRRFGKSLLVSTLKCYFEGRKDLFKGLAMERLETEWAEYPVFHIDFNGDNFTLPGTLEQKIEYCIATWEVVYGKDFTLPGTLEQKLETRIAVWEGEYGKDDRMVTIGDRFAYILSQAHKRYGRRCVVLIDEYDKPILDVLDTGLKTTLGGDTRLLEDWNREVLKGFYSVFKAADDDLQFVLLTGVTKFSQVSVFSGFNQPNDISMDAQYEALCGITQEELDCYFAEPIEELAKKYRTMPEGMREKLKFRYDGYHFSDNLTDVYNPFSLLNAFANQQLRDYWFSSGTPSYLIRLLNHTKEDLNELTGRYYRPEEFIDYKADVEKPLPMIYQSGYLTIKNYDLDFGTFLLDFPNNEVKNGFVSLVASDYLKPREDMGSWIRSVVIALRAGDLEQLRQLFTSFLAGIPYTMRSKSGESEKERFFHYTFYLIFRLVSVYTVYTEKEQSQGRSDCIVETDSNVYIFEFKRDGSADDALAQIEAKGYSRPYAADPRRLYKIGVNFSSQTGTVEEWKVKG